MERTPLKEGAAVSYPKPLSEKSLQRLYSESALSERKIAFLRSFFTACANLYGAFLAEDAWDVYGELSSKAAVVKLQRKDMYKALSILRREDDPFYVFEADEVYTEEKRIDKYRVIALRELVPAGYGKFVNLYSVIETSQGKPFYVPENLLAYEVMPASSYELKLLDMLSHLESTLDEYEDVGGHMRPCLYKGKRLSDFSYISGSEAFELKCLRGEVDGYKDNAKKAEELEKRLNSVTAAEYLVDNLRWRSHVGRVPLSRSLEYFLDDLNIMGVELSRKGLFDEILRAVNNMHNHQHLWCNHGWSPEELSRHMPAGGITSLSFGPNMQRAFAEGAMDKDELIRELSKMGIEVLE